MQKIIKTHFKLALSYLVVQNVVQFPIHCFLPAFPILSTSSMDIFKHSINIVSQQDGKVYTVTLSGGVQGSVNEVYSLQKEHTCTEHT